MAKTIEISGNAEEIAEKLKQATEYISSKAQRENITIKKAKIKDNLFLEAEFTEAKKDGTNTVKQDCTAPVHDDLKLAFKKLNIHLALLAEQVPETRGGTGNSKGISIQKAFTDEEIVWGLDPEETFSFTLQDWQLIKEIQCSGFTVSGSGDNEGVVLSGRRILSNEKVLNVTTPFYKWDDEYDYSSELGEIIEECRSEVYQYLFEGKHQPEAQMSLFDDDNQEDIDDELMR